MSAILVDANVLLDIMTEDPVWGEWSSNTVAELANTSTLVINEIVYAEISVRFESIEELEVVIERSELERRRIPWEAAFLAGKCFRDYRRRGGTKNSPLPDFFIGAHAVIEKLPLLTRDGRVFKTYFPGIRLISPSDIN